MEWADESGATRLFEGVGHPDQRQAKEPSQRQQCPARPGRLSRSLTWLARLLISLYQTLFLLGFHRAYLREDTRASNQYDTYLHEHTAPPTLAGTEGCGWTVTCGNVLASIRKRYALVAANIAALYHVISSIRSPDATSNSIAHVTGIISVVLSAKAVILATFFLQCPPTPVNNLVVLDQDPAKPNSIIIDKRIQVAMLRSVPSASTFWALSSVIVYHCCTLAGAPSIADGTASTDAVTPWWATALIFTTLAVCIIHFFGVVCWMMHLDGEVGSDAHCVLPMPCTTKRRSPSSPPRFLPEGSDSGRFLFSSAAGSQLYITSLDGQTLVRETRATRTDSTPPDATSRNDVADVPRRSRKDTRSPDPYPRTPSASPSPARTRKARKSHSHRNKPQEPPETKVEAPQVVRCSSTSSQPFASPFSTYAV